MYIYIYIYTYTYTYVFTSTVIVISISMFYDYSVLTFCLLQYYAVSVISLQERPFQGSRGYQNYINGVGGPATL